jgi:type IV fimbrial biogenesis protein FimT
MWIKEYSEMPMGAGAHRPGSIVRGFTLIELMVAVAVLAIALGIAAPSLNGIRASGQLSAASSEISTAVQMARQEAIKRGRRVGLCASSTGTSCGGSADWSTGWLIFEDRDANGTWSGGDIAIQSGRVGSDLSLLPSSNVGSVISFRHDGRARASNGALLAGTLAVCKAGNDLPENVRDVSIRTGSQVSTTKRNGSCTTPSN